jgi:hypothetical protein
VIAPGGGRGEVAEDAGDQCLGVGLEPPADRVVELFGRVRRIEDPAHPPLDEVRVIG